ncbi:hypothetical protein FACS189499_07600 [Clostridia bacterium]|nr:hypothetical protein FACS189499_07600 [Clostridia bacterium]
MNYRQNFSQKLKEIRKSRNISTYTLANVLGITHQNVSSLENSKSSPSFEVLCKLADYFNVSLDYLVGRIDNSDER